MQYATALAKRGDQVDVIALRREGTPGFEVIEGVNVFRVQTRTVNEKKLLSYAWRITKFLCRSAVVLKRNHREKSYDFVHVHSVPDFLVFSAIVPKLSGVPVVLDIHDLLPELYASKFGLRENSILFKFLVLIERWSCAFADHVIIANHVWRERLLSRSVSGKKCTAIRNYPDPNVFVALRRQTSDSGRFVITYPGSLNWHQGVDVAIRAFARVAHEMPDSEFHIYGEGPAKPALIDLANTLKMDGRVVFHDFLPIKEIAKVMAETNLAIEPKRSGSRFGNEAASTKILEFMILGVPIIASRTTIHTYYYDDSIIRYYDHDDDEMLSECILDMRHDPLLRSQFAQRASRYAYSNNWQTKKGEYLQLVDSLTGQISISNRPQVQPLSAA
jgi:glycosyltransferase involved in cell wall biosynthesis